MHPFRHMINLLIEANIHKDSWKFWFNVNTGKVFWLGGADHHAHVMYYHAEAFGLSPEQKDYLRHHPAFADEDKDGDGGGRIIYEPALFWHAMQLGWVRGGLEGDYDHNDYDVMHPYGLYLEGKSLIDIARAAKYITKHAAGDSEFPDDDSDWVVEDLRIEVRSGPQREATQTYHLHGRRAQFFMARGRIPSDLMQ